MKIQVNKWIFNFPQCHVVTTHWLVVRHSERIVKIKISVPSYAQTQDLTSKFSERLIVSLLHVVKAVHVD